MIHDRPDPSAWKSWPIAGRATFTAVRSMPTSRTLTQHTASTAALEVSRPMVPGPPRGGAGVAALAVLPTGSQRPASDARRVVGGLAVVVRVGSLLACGRGLCEREAVGLVEGHPLGRRVSDDAVAQPAGAVSVVGDPQLPDALGGGPAGRGERVRQRHQAQVMRGEDLVDGVLD